MENQIEISVVTPIYNEEENINLLLGELFEVLDDLGKDYELITVDDGSSDNTFELLKEYMHKKPQLKIIRFPRNFGQTAALSAGFDHVQGKVVVAIDADLQNDPHDIPKLLKKMEEGYDIVSGWRYKREESWLFRRLPSACANWLASKLFGVYLHDSGCTLKAYSQEVLKNVRLYGELHRFIPSLASVVGARIAEVKVNHRPRKFGRSKYGLSRVIKVILDMFTIKFLLSYSTKPFQLFGTLGLLTGLLGFIFGFYLSILKLAYHQSIGNRPLLLFAVLLIITGVQFFGMGILGELIMRTYHESQSKPIYFIKEILTAEQFENE